MKITQKEFDNIVSMINSKDTETVKLGMGILNMLFPSYDSTWACIYYCNHLAYFEEINCSINQFWLNHIQAHFVE